MTCLLEHTLTHLEKLVSFDTRNPPRAIGTGGIFDYLRANLPGFNVEVIDHGAGAVSLYGPGTCSTCTWTRCPIRRTGAPIRTCCGAHRTA